MPEKKPAKETQNDDQVKLKPILGIKPGYYLACIYGAALLLILFFLLINPGLKKPGALVSIKSEPWGAAVLVDGIYMDAAPCKIFIPEGKRTIELSLPGFSSKKLEMDIGNRVFASAIFPLRMEIEQELKPQSNAGTFAGAHTSVFTGALAAAFVNEAAEFAAWSFAGEPGPSYQIPLVLSEGVYRFGPAASDPTLRQIMNDTILASSRFAHTRAGLRDLVRAKTLLDNNGLSPSPLSLLSSAAEAIAFLSENPASSQWLSETLPRETAALVRSSSWHAASKGEKYQVREAPSLQVYGNIRFMGVTASSSAISGAGIGAIRGAVSGVTNFHIAEAPITQRAWNLFLEEKNEWKPENLYTLLDKDLVDLQYMAEWDFAGSPYSGMAWVSWHAAEAWCEWYNSKLPAAEGLEARLPTETEWRIAAELLKTGDYWEWCEDPFVPLPYLSSPSYAISALGSPERSLRGGSWINKTGTVDIDTRASLPPHFCSPFVSFRPVLVPKGNRL